MKTYLVFEGLLEVREDRQAGSDLRLWSHVHSQFEHEASRYICQCCDTKFFITNKWSHWWTSKLVDRLHSCRVTRETRWKQNDVRCFSESRLRDKWTHRRSHCSPPRWPPLLLVTLKVQWAVSHGHRVVKSRTVHMLDWLSILRVTLLRLLLAAWCKQHDFGLKPFIVFAFPFSKESLTWSVRGPKVRATPFSQMTPLCQRSYWQTRKRLSHSLWSLLKSVQ